MNNLKSIVADTEDKRVWTKQEVHATYSTTRGERLELSKNTVFQYLKALCESSNDDVVALGYAEPPLASLGEPGGKQAWILAEHREAGTGLFDEELMQMTGNYTARVDRVEAILKESADPRMWTREEMHKEHNSRHSNESMTTAQMKTCLDKLCEQKKLAHFGKPRSPVQAWILEEHREAGNGLFDNRFNSKEKNQLQIRMQRVHGIVAGTADERGWPTQEVLQEYLRLYPNATTTLRTVTTYLNNLCDETNKDTIALGLEHGVLVPLAKGGSNNQAWILKEHQQKGETMMKATKEETKACLAFLKRTNPPTLSEAVRLGGKDAPTKEEFSLISDKLEEEVRTH